MRRPPNGQQRNDKEKIHTVTMCAKIVNMIDVHSCKGESKVTCDYSLNDFSYCKKWNKKTRVIRLFFLIFSSTLSRKDVVHSNVTRSKAQMAQCHVCHAHCRE